MTQEAWNEEMRKRQMKHLKRLSIFTAGVLVTVGFLVMSTIHRRLPPDGKESHTWVLTITQNGQPVEVVNVRDMEIVTDRPFEHFGTNVQYGWKTTVFEGDSTNGYHFSARMVK